MAETDPPAKCGVCKKTKADNEKKLLQCSRCKMISYCGQSCQKQDWPSHRNTCSAPNYILKIDLAPDYIHNESSQSISNPSISRTLSCPASATFAQLHEALQTAFGYTSTHTYDFEIKDPNAQPEDTSIVSLVNQLAAMSPSTDSHADRGPRQNLLRIVEFEGPVTGHHLARAKDAMHTNLRKHSQTPEIVASKIKLSKVFENKEYRDCTFEYTYDFGDSWWHIITVAGRVPASSPARFLCLEGEGHGVAEDVGSIPGWQKLKEAYRAEKPNPEQREKMDWFEKMASNGDPAGLGGGREHFWDIEEVNRNLGDIL